MIVRNALAALPGEKDFRKMNFSISGGKIHAMGEDLSHLPGDDEVLDAKGLFMFPGAIDPHVHFDEPGFTHREDFLHGTSEAARGGVTTVIDMPCTSLPPITSPQALENKLSIVSKSAMVDFAFYGGISGLIPKEEIEKIVSSLAQSVVGFKCYFVSGMDTFTAVNLEQFEKALSSCAKAGRPLLLHSEDPSTIEAASARLAAERGGKAPQWRDYYLSRPEEAEMAAARAALSAAGANAAWLHIVHIGLARAAAAVAETGASCETCPHYLAFDENDFSRFGAALKTAPPVKGPAQKALLWRQLSDGTISFVTSDHAGAPDYEKFTGNPLTAYGGIPGTGTLFPYLLSEGLFAKRIELARFLEIVSGGAAKRYGLWKGKGSLEAGKDADFVLVDPDTTMFFSSTKMESKSRITPFDGMRLAGRIVGTFVRGSCVFGTERLAAYVSPDARDTQMKVMVPAAVAAARGFGSGKVCGTPGNGKFIKWGYA
jgi:allantoinase